MGMARGASWPLHPVRPYIRYYNELSSPPDDTGRWPVVLFVLRDEIAENGFLETALPEVSRRGYHARHRLRLMTTTEELIAKEGVAEPIWKEKARDNKRWTPWHVWL